MSLVVNTNINSLTAQRNLNTSNNMLTQALTRLSSGQRINSGADDAAGQAISTRIGVQVRLSATAIRNANDGVALSQTAEGALQEITNIMTRIKELALQSVNSTNSSTDRTSLNQEVQAQIAEVTRIATQTKVGTIALLDGTFVGNFQVGLEQGQTVSATISNFRASSLSGQVASQALTFLAGLTSVGAAEANSYLGVNSGTALQITGPRGTSFIRQTTASDDTVSAIENAQSAIASAAAINESTSTTGVSATVTAATFTTAGTFANDLDVDGTTNTLRLNGQSVVVNLNGGSVANRRQQLIDAVNSQVSGVTAAVGAGAADVVLTAADGRNVSVQTSAGTGANTVSGEVFGFTTAPTTAGTIARGGISLQAGGNLTSTFTNADQVAGEGLTSAAASTLQSLTVATVSGANSALLVADSIIETINSQRATLGAIQNRLASTIANLQVVQEKLADFRSRILDADFAAETANLSKSQILRSAGLSVLAQANSAPASVLELLRNQ
jgi:flagellin